MQCKRRKQTECGIITSWQRNTSRLYRIRCSFCAKISITRESYDIKFVVYFKRLFDSSNNSPWVRVNNPLHTRYETPQGNSEFHRCSFPADAHPGVHSPGIINAKVSVLLGCEAMSLIIWFPTFLHHAMVLKYRQTIIHWHGVTNHNNRNASYSIA